MCWWELGILGCLFSTRENIFSPCLKILATSLELGAVIRNWSPAGWQSCRVCAAGADTETDTGWAHTFITCSEELQKQNSALFQFPQPLGAALRVRAVFELCRIWGSAQGRGFGTTGQRPAGTDAPPGHVTSGNSSTKPPARSAESLKVTRPWGKLERMGTDDKIESLPNCQLLFQHENLLEFSSTFANLIAREFTWKQ